VRKFYVHSGNNKLLRLAHTPIQAAYLACEYWVKTEVEEVDGIIKVSEKGFNSHEDDFIVCIYDIILLIRKNNLYKKKN
jgi:hypothetical protein